MSDRKLTVSFVAAVDASSFSAAQGTIVRQAKKANDQMAADAKKATREERKARADALKETLKDFDAMVAGATKEADAEIKQANRAAKERKKASADEVAQAKRDNAERTRNDNAYWKQRQRWAKEAEAEAKRLAQAEKAAGPSGKRTMGDRIMTGVGTRIVSSMISAPGRLAGDLLRGAGVDTSVGGQIGSSVNRELLANKIANAGWIESGRGPAGSETRADPKQLLAESYSIGDKTGFTSEQVLGGMDKFVGMTGDLKTARSSMEMFGKIAKANSMDLNEMMDSVARLSMAMGDVPDKGEAIVATFRTMAGQGHIGSVMMDELGANMGKLATRAGSFTIDKKSAETLNSVGVTNSIGQRTAVMGALMQMASKGGRIGATQASNSATALIDDMRRGTMGKRLAEIGMTSFADASKTSEADPMDVIMSVLEKSRTKGGVDLAKVAKAFPNKQAAALGNEAGLEYNNFYKEAAARGIVEESQRQKYAMEKLSDEFQNFLRVTQSAEGVTARFEAMMGTTSGKANAVNTELGKASDELKKLTPLVIDLAKAFTIVIPKGVSLIDWLTKPHEEQEQEDIVKSQDTRIAADRAASVLEEAGANATPEQIAAGKTAQRDIAKAIADKKKQMEATDADHLAGALSSHQKGASLYADMTPEEVDKRARSGDSKAGVYIQEMRDLKALIESSQRLDRDAAWVDNFEKVLRREPLEVRMVNLPAATVEPATSGTAPGDTGTGERHPYY